MSAQLLCGDALTVLKTLPDQSVQCCVTSPPYWNQRDYEVAGQIGLEPSLAAYVDVLMLVFREVRRVLRDDGTCWVNSGDTYASAGGAGMQGKNGRRATRTFTAHSLPAHVPAGLKPKDLCMVPARLAMAMQADGWYLRQDIIWAKPAPLPESVQDRCTRSYEHLFLLAARERYYYDALAIAEPLTRPDEGNPYTGTPTGTRNKRDVWTIHNPGLPSAHFAVMPEALVQPCILAGSSPRACAVCGAPWERVVQRDSWNERTHRRGEARGWVPVPNRTTEGAQQRIHNTNGQTSGVPVRTTGWQPTCTCPNVGTGRCTVLDPFCGSGTVGVVALSHGRHFIGVDLNPAYIQLSRERLGLFAPREAVTP